MRVVLDTTAFHPWGPKRTKPLLRLFRAAKEYDMVVYVPEVVIAETRRHYMRDHAEPTHAKVGAAKKAAGKLGLSVPGLNEFKPDPSAARAQFEKDLREELKSYSVKTLPLPSVSHADVLKRIMAARKPSKTDEDSYRDILIWCGVVELLQERSTPTLLVTNNWKDFGAGNESRRLHRDLEDDLKAAGCNPDAVERYATPAAVVSEHLAVKDAVASRMAALVQSDDPKHQELVDLLRDSIVGEFVTGDVHLSLESDIESMIVAAVYALSVSLDGVYEIEHGEDYGVSLKVSAEVELEVLVSAPLPWELASASADEVIGDRSGGGYLLPTKRTELMLPVDLVWNKTAEDWVPDEAYLGEVTELLERPLETYDGPIPGD